MRTKIYINQTNLIIDKIIIIKETFSSIIKIIVAITSINIIYLLFDKFIIPFINKDIKTDLSNDTELVLEKKDNESDTIVSLPKNPVLNIKTNIMIDNKEEDTNSLATTASEQPNTNTIIDPVILSNPPIVYNDIHPINLPGEDRDVIIIE